MGTSIPASNNVVRYCPLGSLAGDRATRSAFQLHPGSATRRPDTYLSVYWLEFLGGRLGGTGLTITHEPRGEKPKDPHSGIHGYGFNEVGEEIAAHLAEIASEQLYPAKV